MTAPERIWATTNGIQPSGGAAGLWRSDTPCGGEVYVRADLAAIPAHVRKKFPVLGSGGASVDLQLVEDHGEQARKNHYQTIMRLAERGGLSWAELFAVLHNRPFHKIDTNEAMIACRALEARYLAAIDVQPDPRDAQIAALVGALRGCITAIEHADMADGVCCCGDEMEGHSDPMDCGHTPTDRGEHYAHQVLTAAKAALSARPAAFKGGKA